MRQDIPNPYSLLPPEVGCKFLFCSAYYLWSSDSDHLFLHLWAPVGHGHVQAVVTTHLDNTLHCIVHCSLQNLIPSVHCFALFTLVLQFLLKCSLQYQVQAAVDLLISPCPPLGVGCQKRLALTGDHEVWGGGELHWMEQSKTVQNRTNCTSHSEYLVTNPVQSALPSNKRQGAKNFLNIFGSA